MSLKDVIKTAILEFKYDYDIQYWRLSKYDKKMRKKHGHSLYWSDYPMTEKIVECMMLQNNDPYKVAVESALWLTKRLRYTNDEVVKLIKDFGNDEYHYDYVLYGMRIFDVMKKYCVSYPEAILLCYEAGTNFEENWMISRYWKSPENGLKMQYAYDFDLDNRIKYDFNKYNDVLPNLTVEQHEELMAAVRTSSIKIAKELGVITYDKEFDNLNLDEHKELKAKLIKNEKQILVDKGLWNDGYSNEYWTDEERAAKRQKFLEDGKKIMAERGISYEDNE